MNNMLVKAAAAGSTDTTTAEVLDADESGIERLSKAVGENALLSSEVDRQLALRLLEVREEVRAANSDLAGLRQQLDHFAQGIVHSMQILRSEWLRRAQAPGLAAQSAGGITPRLISMDKVLAMGADLRLNLGCGSRPLARYLNVDQRELGSVDLIADVRALPFSPQSVSEIYAAHLLEHFTEPDLRSKVLPAWHNLLKPGGMLRIVVPDAEGMIEAFSHANYPFESLRTVTFGSQDYPGNFHYTMFSRESLLALLRESHFLVTEYTATSRVNGLCLEMEIAAVRGA